MKDLMEKALGGVAFWLFCLLPLYANHRGMDGFVFVGTSLIGELRGWETNEESNTIEDTILTDTWETNQPGTRRWTGTMNCWWDESDTNGQEALAVGGTVVCKFYMEGTGTGATFKQGTAVVTNVRGAGAINGIVERNITVRGNGALTQTTV